MSELRSEDGTFAVVTALMDRDGDRFSAEDSGVQKSLGGRARGGLQNESAVCRCFGLDIDSTIDSGDLLLRPQNVDFPEGDTIIAGLNNQI